ncbi:MAG: hypothetical protein K2M23_00665, partial [Alphaproteobacteria bacterium]|nr:hypothetical protein [Alphaproteobacteria bacterium]
DLTLIKDSTKNKKDITFPKANDEQLITKLETIITSLKNAEYNCENGFKSKIKEEKLTYKITYTTHENAKWDAKAINKIKAGFESSILDTYDETNIDNWEEIEEIKAIIDSFKNPKP